MSVLVKNLSDFLNLLVQSFNLSAVLPSIVFMMFLQLYIFPSFPEGSAFIVLARLDSNSQMTFNIIFVVVFAYLLDAANMWIIRLFEGYPLINQFPFNILLELNKKRVQQTIYNIEKLEELLDKYIDEYDKTQEQSLREEKFELIVRCRQILRDHLEQVTNRYPETPYYILPLRLGNVIAASEQYPKKVFGMDAITLWPFLRPILTEKDYAQFVIKEKAIMDFLLNMTVILTLCGITFGMVELHYAGFNALSDKMFLGKLALLLASAYIIFRLSIQGAMSWGTTIRVAFVLFRDELRNSLQLKKPQTYKEERILWENTSNFLKTRPSTEKQLMKWSKAIFDDAERNMS